MEVCARLHAFAFVLLMDPIYIKPFIQGTGTERESANCLKAQRGKHSYPYLSVTRILSTSIRLYYKVRLLARIGLSFCLIVMLLGEQRAGRDNAFTVHSFYRL